MSFQQHNGSFQQGGGGGGYNGGGYNNNGGNDFGRQEQSMVVLNNNNNGGSFQHQPQQQQHNQSFQQHPSFQQQQQQNPNNQSFQRGQSFQQGQGQGYDPNNNYGGQQQGGYMDQGCCAPAPGGPNASTCPMCCPEDPNQHFCNTDPNQEIGNPNSSMFLCCWQCCDFTTWLTALITFLCAIGFILVLALHGSDDLLNRYSVSNAAELEAAAFWDKKINSDHFYKYTAMENMTDAPPPSTASPPTPAPVRTRTIVIGATTAAPKETRTRTLRLPRLRRTRTRTLARRRRTRTRTLALLQPTRTRTLKLNISSLSLGRRLMQQVPSVAPTLPPLPSPRPPTQCYNESKLIGSYGALCMEETLSSTAMMMNISRWVNFRATLYFIAMMGCFVIGIIIVLVHKQRFPVPLGSTTPAPPYQFYATPLYYCFRLVWGTLSIVFFFWICTEMYQYWWFIDYYCDRTSGKLLEFWQDFDTKFMWTMIIIFVFLCWPLCHLVLECVWFILFGPIWFCVRQTYPMLATHERDPTIPQDELSCCVRSNIFFCEMNQLWRAGFSEGQWRLLTGTTTPFFTCCADPNQQQQYNQQNAAGLGDGARRESQQQDVFDQSRRSTSINTGGASAPIQRGNSSSMMQRQGSLPGNTPSYGGPSPMSSMAIQSSGGQQGGGAGATPTRQSSGWAQSASTNQSQVMMSPSNQFGVNESVSMSIDPTTGEKKKKKKKKTDGEATTEKKKKKKKKAEGLVSDSDA